MVKTGVFKMRQWAQGPQVEEVHSGPGMSQRGDSGQLYRRKDLWVWSRTSSENGEKELQKEAEQEQTRGGIWHLANP